MNKDKMQLSTDQRSFTMVYNDFLDSEYLTKDEKILFIALKRYCNDNNQCFPSIAKLSKVSRMSESVVKRTIKSLEEKKVILKQNRKKADGGKTSNLYTIYDLKELWKSQDSEEAKGVVDLHEIERAIELLQSTGYSVTKEKAVESEPTKAQTQPLKSLKSNLDIANDSLNASHSQVESYPMEVLKEQFGYEVVKKFLPYDSCVDATFTVLYDTLNSRKSVIRVSSEEKPAEVVKGRLLKLTYGEIIYAIEQFHKVTERISNVDGYVLTCLYKAAGQSVLDYSNKIKNLYG